MRLEIDPVWPWSELRQFLADSPDPVIPLLIWSTGLLALALPLVTLRLEPRGTPPAAGRLGSVLRDSIHLGCPDRLGYMPMSGLAERIRNASLGLLIIVPMGLLGVMLRTYVLAPGVTRRRLLAIIALRLAAVACAIVAVTRPYLGFPDSTRTGAVVLILHR